MSEPVIIEIKNSITDFKLEIGKFQEPDKAILKYRVMKMTREKTWLYQTSLGIKKKEL